MAILHPQRKQSGSRAAVTQGRQQRNRRSLQRIIFGVAMLENFCLAWPSQDILSQVSSQLFRTFAPYKDLSLAIHNVNA
jgi:hypothetical protein